MPSLFQKKLRLPLPAAVWLLGFIAVALIGGSLLMDLSGQSNADQFVLTLVALSLTTLVLLNSCRYVRLV